MELSSVYEIDETAWLDQMSKLIVQGRYEELDYQHLSEFLLDMAERDRREALHRLTGLLTHVLKWDHQLWKRSGIWESAMLRQRYELQDLLDSRTLENYALEILPKAYARATKYVATETGLAQVRFPHECPYTLRDLLSEA